MNDLDYAYFAGFFDGEGCVDIQNVATRQWRCYVLRVRVTNTNAGVIEQLQSYFGGAIRTHKRVSDRHKVCYEWQVSCRNALRFLVAVVPYLRVKKRQTEIAIAFQETMQWTLGSTLDASMIVWRDEQMQMIHTLNKSQDFRSAKSLSPNGDKLRRATTNTRRKKPNEKWKTAARDCSDHQVNGGSSKRLPRPDQRPAIQ